MSREQIKSVVILANSNDGSALPENAIDFIRVIQAGLDEIPEQYRGAAIIEITGEAWYDGGASANIEMYYYRPESDFERSERAKKEQAHADAQQKQELKLFLELKAKYGQ